MSGVARASQIDYKQSMFSHPSYKFAPQYPNTFGQAISLGTSQTPVTINIPPTVFNLSESILSYTVILPDAGAGNYIWYAQQMLAEISHIQFYSGSNQWIVDVDNLQNYLDIVVKKELSLSDFSTLDLSLDGVGLSNSGNNGIKALRNSNMTPANVNAGQAYNSNLNYVEPSYFNKGAVGDGAFAGQVMYNVQVPLKMIRNTGFSVNKNMYFGQTTYLRMYFGSIDKVAYQSDSATGPCAGIKTLYTRPATITNLQLMLAVESNENQIADIKTEVSTTGLTYLIPYVQSFKNSNNGGSQNINIQFDQGSGRSLMKVYHAIYNSQESLNTMYDHCNTSDVPGAAATVGAPQKTQVYYTQLNGQRIQDISINCSPTANPPLLDYMSHRRQIHGSVLQNANIYQYNWFHCDDFCDFDIDYTNQAKSELIAGIPMTVAPLTWGFVGVTMVNLVYYHYTWCVFVKKLTMTPSTITVQ